MRRCGYICIGQSDVLAVVLSGEAFVAASLQGQICHLLLRGGLNKTWLCYWRMIRVEWVVLGVNGGV